MERKHEGLKQWFIYFPAEVYFCLLMLWDVKISSVTGNGCRNVSTSEMHALKKAIRYFIENKQNPVETVEVTFYIIFLTDFVLSFLLNSISNHLCFLKVCERMPQEHRRLFCKNHLWFNHSADEFAFLYKKT